MCLEQKSNWTKLCLCFQAECVLHTKTNSYWIRIFQVCFTACYVGKLFATDGTTLVLIFLENTGVRIVRLFIPGLTNLKPICEMCIALKLPSTLVGLVLSCPKMGMNVLPLKSSAEGNIAHMWNWLQSEENFKYHLWRVICKQKMCGNAISYDSVFVIVSYIYSVIKKNGLNFVSLYFKIRTCDKYDVNYIWLYSQWSL